MRLILFICGVLLLSVFFADPVHGQDVLDKIVATIPVKRLGTPEEIASMISWVASDEAGFATGADFSVNGGLHMG